MINSYCSSRRGLENYSTPQNQMIFEPNKSYMRKLLRIAPLKLTIGHFYDLRVAVNVIQNLLLAKTLNSQIVAWQQDNFLKTSIISPNSDRSFSGGQPEVLPVLLTKTLKVNTKNCKAQSPSAIPQISAQLNACTKLIDDLRPNHTHK